MKFGEGPPFSVAVCGHFSAGKSTLLNRLLGADLLPSSPVPTTANIMKIVSRPTSGLIAKANDGEERSFEGHIPWEELQSFARDGKYIRDIKLMLPLPYLPAGVTLSDTPGVDSTDESHEAYTTTELLATDAVIYVTDYNHVRSETNLRFLRQMQRENKPIVLVVNQIDKHDEKELPFSIFAHGLRDMLQRFGIHPVRLYFTSCHEEDHPYNELGKWVSEMRSWFYHAKSLKELSRERMVQSAVAGLKERLYLDREQETNAIEETLMARGFSKGDHQALRQAHECLSQLDEEEAEAVQHLRHQLDQFFKQTYLFPHETTELTKAWLESFKPSFKVGFFGSKKKKQEEQEHREKELIAELKRRWETEVRLYLSERLKKEPLNECLAHKAQEAIDTIPFHAEKPGWLRSFLTAGEKNDQYVYQLTAKMNQALMQTVKQTIEPLFIEIEEDFKKRTFQERSQLEEKLAHYEEVANIEAENEWKLKSIDKAIEQVCEYIPEKDQRYEDAISTCMERTPNLEGVSDHIEVTEQNEQNERVTPQFSMPLEDELIYEDDPLGDLFGLESMLLENNKNPYAEEARCRLLATIDKAKNHRYTFVMSGAFSAGKSTFLNALVKEEIMPVSPHPTTASLTIVRYPMNDYQHGDVSVRLKSEAALDAEIQDVAYECGYSFNLSRLKKAEGLSITKTNTLDEKQRLEYLRALQSGVKKEQYTFGQTYNMSLTEWQEIAAKEDHACLIEMSTVYFCSDITAEGWSLVDTPGVQSVNERHTRLAIEQIKEADAFFYLTYYHHAFSQADQSFIDKIRSIHPPDYMLINAADLAKDDRESRYVLKHVNEQLTQTGCQSTETFALSSKRALTSAGDKGFSDLSNHLEKVMKTKLQIKSKAKIQTQLQQLINELQSVIHTMERPLSERVKVAEKEKRNYRSMEPNFDKMKANDEEIHVWKGYVERRILLQMDDAFKTVVNAAAVYGNDKNERKNNLMKALETFLQKCEYIWSQEMDTLSRQVQESLEQSLKSMGITLQDFLTNEVEFNFLLVSLQPLVKARKCKKSFFFDGEYDAMKEEVFSLMKPHVRNRIEIAAEEMHKTRNRHVETVKEDVHQRMLEEKERQVERLQFLQSESPDIEGLKNEIQQLEQW
nr:dynamin family protein [Geomicrobium halophilum]